MLIDILLIILVTSFIQSLFGVGVLLFGTPLLLLLGYEFIDAVLVLLPVSLSINLIQMAKDYRRVDWAFYRKILLYTIPCVIIFLFVVARWQINIGLVVGPFLLFVAVKDYSYPVNRLITFLVGYEKAYLVTLGVIHGLTNLGGSLLTAIVHSKGHEKHIARVTIAFSYATLASFQLLTLLLSGNSNELRLANSALYVLVGITMFVLTEKIVYVAINARSYSRYFALFLFLSGVVLCVRSL